jgi:hypothetical protein
VAGLALGLAEGESECQDWLCAAPEWSAGEAAAAGLLSGAAFGAGVGALVGALIGTEQWEQVPVEAITVNAGNGFVLSVSLQLPRPGGKRGLAHSFRACA